MSRRDDAIVAWHEVPGSAPSQKTRPVGYGLIVQVYAPIRRISTRNTFGISCGHSYRALRDGSFEGRFLRHFVPGYDRVVPPGRAGKHPAKLELVAYF
jgi:hypothetical protein